MKNLGKFKLNEDFNVFLVSLGIVLIVAGLTSCSLKKVDEEVTNSILQYQSVYNIMQPKLAVMSASVEEEIEESGGFVFREIIPLNEDLQRNIFDITNEKEISYELMMAIAYTESNFNIKARSKNAKEDSQGLFQINAKDTLRWLAKETGLGENVDPYDPRHSALMATWYIRYLTDYYTDKGMHDEVLTNSVLMAYNMGIGRANKAIANGVTTTKYVEKVIEYKIYLEEGDHNS